MALLLTAELLRFDPQSQRADEVLNAMARAAAEAGVQVQMTDRYRGGADLLMLWGPGHPARFSPMAQQLAAGGRVACWDLSYWARDSKYRISIDAPHPQAVVMQKNWPADRFIADRVAVGDYWTPDGPVIVAGLGRKARVQYGAEHIDRWEARMIGAAVAHGCTVLYRRKQGDAFVPYGVQPASDGPIDQVLAGASRLVTWHSNVAVDAIRLGIPAVCADGAAAAVCPSEMTSDQKPLPPAIRDIFLANLAWFQWAPSEATGTWSWLREVLA